MKKIKYALGLGAVLFLAFSGTAMTAEAVNYNYVTITVDAVDDSGSLQYAIDSDDPEAFGDTSSFEVVPGSTHTIYVKDMAGNVTSQVYSIPEPENKEETPEPARQDGIIKADTNVSESFDSEAEERKINIDVNLANGSYTSSGAGNAAEEGGGTLFDKEKTDGTDASGKIFYTVTTKEGEVFYLVVDQNRNDNNVYLLTQATVNDLQYLADQNNYNFTVAGTGQSSQSLLNMLSGNGGQGAGTESALSPGEPSATESSGMNSTLLLVVIAVIGGGAYYFLKTKRDRREKQMDEIDAANDLQDYEIEDEEDEDDILDFEEEPAEQKQDSDDDLRDLITLDTTAAFGEEGEDEDFFKGNVTEELENTATIEMGLDDYDEFGQEE